MPFTIFFCSVHVHRCCQPLCDINRRWWCSKPRVRLRRAAQEPSRVSYSPPNYCQVQLPELTSQSTKALIRNKPKLIDIHSSSLLENWWLVTDRSARSSLNLLALGSRLVTVGGPSVQDAIQPSGGRSAYANILCDLRVNYWSYVETENIK